MGQYEDAFPYLDHFLAAYLHQDWSVVYSGRLENVLEHYVRHGPIDEAHALRADIRRFLTFKSNDIDAEYDRLFPDSVLPSAWGMSTRDWLVWVDRLVAENLGPPNS